MQIKRIEPNKTLMIRFCCDDMIYSMLSCVASQYYLNPNDRVYARGPIEKEIVACPFCGTKIDYGEGSTLNGGVIGKNTVI